MDVLFLLYYTGNRGSGAENVLGTAMQSVLCGHWRYAHINAVRGDGINPGLLGMKGTVSEDAVRLGIGRIGQKEGLDWLGGHVLESIAPALGLPWILDIDVTIKPLYGHQQGAQISLWMSYFHLSLHLFGLLQVFFCIIRVYISWKTAIATRAKALSNQGCGSLSARF